jgi:hypothetical protein
MFRKIVFAMLSSLLVLGLAAFPVFASTTVVRVAADAAWVDSGIDVVLGETVSLTAKGFAITGPLDEYPEAKSGAGGQVTTCVDGALPGMVCMLDGVPFGALIGMVGGNVFLIGDSTSFVAGASGRLYLAVNDFVGTYADNAGGFTVLFSGL